MKRSKKLIYSSLIPLLLLSVFINSECGKHEGTDRNGEKPPIFNNHILSNYNIDPSCFEGRYIYVHFINIISPEKEISIKEIIRELENSTVINVIFVITKDDAISKFESASKNICFIWDKSGHVHDELRAASCCESYQIYNRKRELMHQGMMETDYKKEIRPFLIEILKNGNIQYFDTNFKLSKIREFGLLGPLKQEPDRLICRNPYSFVGLISKVCSVCPIAHIINRINLYSKEPLGLSKISIYLPSYFSQVDIENFRATFNILIPIMRSSPKTMEIWANLKNTFPGMFDNIFMVINLNGEILALLDEQSDINNIFKYLESRSL